MRLIRSITCAALALFACSPTAAVAQMPTLAKGAPILTAAERAAGLDTAAPKSVADFNKRFTALPIVVADAVAKARTGPAAPPVPIGNPEWARNNERGDGWNPVWYAHIRPDVVAAKVNPLDHWNTFGKWEGTPPFENAPAWAPSSVKDYFVGSPSVVMPEVWAPAGVADVRVQVFLVRGNTKPVERSFSAILRTDGHANSDDRSPFLPSTGSRKEYLVNVGAGYVGSFTVSILSADNPGWRASTKVHVGETPPAGYVYPAAFPTPAPTPFIAPSAAPSFDDSLADMTKWNTGGYNLNGMKGWFVRYGQTKTVSGKIPDPFPLVNGVRRFLPVDQRKDFVVAENGQYFGWAMPGALLPIGSATGTWIVKARLPNWVSGMDPGTWGIRFDGAWPPELDHVERFAHLPGIDMTTFHGDGNIQQGFASYNGPTVMHERAWRRTTASEEPVFKLPMYRQWVRVGAGPWVLKVECPDYLVGQPIATNLSLEGWGGSAAGGSEPAANDNEPFDAVAAGAYMDVERVRYWAN